MGGGNSSFDDTHVKSYNKGAFSIVDELPATRYSKALEDWKYQPDPSIGYGFAAARRRASQQETDPLNPYTTPEMQAADRERKSNEMMGQELEAKRADNYQGQNLQLQNERFLADRYGPQVVQNNQQKGQGFWSSLLGAGAQVGAAALLASDERLKEDIEPVEKVLPRLAGNHAFNYTWRDSGQADAGVVAQRLNKSFPEAVQPGDDEAGKPWAVNPTAVGAIALQGVKELNDKVDKIAKRRAKLKEAA